jgi:hypothetical protein
LETLTVSWPSGAGAVGAADNAIEFDETLNDGSLTGALELPELAPELLVVEPLPESLFPDPALALVPGSPPPPQALSDNEAVSISTNHARASMLRQIPPRELWCRCTYPPGLF